MARSAVLLCAILLIAQFACAEPAAQTRNKGDVHDAAANNKPPRPVQLVAAQAPAAPKLEELRNKQIELNRLQAEVRQLRAETGTPQQILVHLQMLEVSLTKLRKLGTDVSFFGSGSTKLESVESLTKAIESSCEKLPTGSAGKNDALLGFINWMKENNIAKTLSEPTIVVLDGRPAQFNVGREIPVPARGDSKSAVEFQQVGTQVDIVPIAQGNNRVRLELRARVSEEDDSRSLEIGGSHVPAIDVRQIDTAVETELGKSVVLNGFVEQIKTTVEQQGGETTDETVDVALLFVVTPELLDDPRTANLPYGPSVPK
jgi:Flp pilus assembly secretin CpaC